tara:strand:- start:10274 stop:10882 length:609 start_codon:yes stop_codon:yes gene_type:complete
MGWMAAVPGILSAATGIYSAYKGAKSAGKPIDLSQIYDKNNPDSHLYDWKQGIDKQANLSGEMLDPNSKYNQDTLTNFKQSGMDFAAMSGRQNARNMSSGGIGGFSGLVNAINNSSTIQAQNQSMDAWNKSLFGNQKLGTSLLGQATKGYKEFGSTMADGYLQNDALARTASLGKSAGINEGIMGLLANPEFSQFMGFTGGE